MQEYKNKVRILAIKAAKEKAEFLTKEVGIELGEIVNITESSPNYTNRSYSLSNVANTMQNVAPISSDNYDDSGISLGMISISSTVNLTYLIKED